MEGVHSSQGESRYRRRRERIHELLIALINKQESFGLMDDENPITEGKRTSGANQDPAAWLERNRRLLKKYQALVRSAVTLDALLDAEEDGMKG